MTLSPALPSLLAFVGVAGLLTMTPGVDTAMVLRSAVSGGPRAGLAAVFGVCLGLSVWGLAAAFGITALLAGSRLAFAVVKWAGAAYLAYLGVKLLSAKPAPSLGPTQAIVQTGGSAAGAFRRALLGNLLNPKVGVFFLTLFPQFIPRGVNGAAFSMLLAGVQVMLALTWFSILVALAVPLGRWLTKRPVARALDRLTGCVFVGFGVKLALSWAA